MAEKTVKPRPPIAAKERGPGPGRYNLPGTIGSSNHMITKKQSPTFSFGTRLPTSFIKNTSSPGPVHAVDPKLARTGASKPPAFTMAGRQKEKTTGLTPAPGAYSPEKVKVDKGSSSAAYTMRSRSEMKITNDAPPPNTYAVPSTLDKKGITLTGRSAKGGFAEDKSGAPGPGKYAVTSPDKFKKKPPAYSMRARTQLPQDATKKPGPGAHRPEQVKTHKKNSPAYTMGSRHSEYTTQLIVDVPDY